MEENKNFEEASANNPNVQRETQPMNSEQPNNAQNIPYGNVPPVQDQNMYGNFAYQQAPVTPEPKPMGFAIASMVLGICSLVFGCCVWYIGLPCAIVGICLAGLSLKRKQGGKGMAIAGLVTSIVAIVFVFLALIGFISFSYNTGRTVSNWSDDFWEGFKNA